MKIEHRQQVKSRPPEYAFREAALFFFGAWTRSGPAAAGNPIADLPLFLRTSAKILISSLLSSRSARQQESPDKYILDENESVPIDWKSRFPGEEWQLIERFPVPSGISGEAVRLFARGIDGRSAGCAPPPEDYLALLLTSLYEESLSWEPVLREGEWQITCSRLPQKSEGKYYTPRDVVRYMVENTLRPLCGGRNPDEILELRILDPAMGCGQFLREAAQFLTDEILRSESAEVPGRRHAKGQQRVLNDVLANCLWGADCDPFAVFLARHALGGNVPPGMAEAHLISGNSLTGNLPGDGDIFGTMMSSARDPIHWQEVFPEIFSGSNPGFDVVIGNPPWVSSGIRGTGKLSKEESAFYRERFPNSAEYKINSFALFIERSIRLLRKGGFHSFIVPDSFLNGRYFSKIRKYMLTTTELRNIVVLGEKTWKGIHPGRSVIYVTRKPAKRLEKTPFNALFVNSPDKLTSGGEGYPQSPEKILHNPPYRIQPVFNRTQDRLVTVMNESSVRLGSLIAFYSGLIGRRGKDSIVLTARPEDTDGSFGLLIDSGKCLERYRLTYRGRYIKKERELYKSGYSPEIYENPKMLLNQTGFSLKACIDTEGYYCLNNLHVAYARGGRCSLPFVTAVLNSRAMEEYYHIVSMEFGRPLAQTDIETLETLPVPDIPFTLSRDERIAFIRGFPMGAAGSAHLEIMPSDSSKEAASMIGTHMLPDGAPAKCMVAALKDLTRDPETVLHDWAHIASSVLMALYRMPHNSLDTFEIQPPPGIPGTIAVSWKHKKRVSTTGMETLINDIMNELYGLGIMKNRCSIYH